MIGELHMKGMEANGIADVLNAAGYRTGGKRFGARLFTSDTVTAMLRNEFFAAFTPGVIAAPYCIKGNGFADCIRQPLPMRNGSKSALYGIVLYKHGALPAPFAA